MTVSITLHNHDVCCVLYLEHYAVYSTAYYMITAYHDMITDCGILLFALTECTAFHLQKLPL